MKKLFALLSCLSLLSACQNTATPLASSNIPAPQVQAQSTPRFYNTAKDGLWRAQIEARRWDFSARLSKVEARWVDENGRSFDWIYYFTAIGKSKAYKVEGGSGEEVHEFLSGTIFDASWRVDSDKAIEIAKEKGLKNFPVYSVELDSFMTWEIRSSNGFFRVPAR